MSGGKNLTWTGLRAATPARVALGRSGTGLPTAAHLDFELAHARARDAVHATLDQARLTEEVRTAGLEPLDLHSAATDRATYLRRPDLGRRLSDESRECLQARATAPIDILFIIGDGLSATAVNAHAMPLLLGTIVKLGEPRLRIGPVVVVEGARVAIGDEIGGILGVGLAAILIGERPGLSAADSLGVYVTWQPAPGMVDAQRNCISNIRPEGLPIPRAAEQLVALIAAAQRYRMTGVELSRRLASEPALNEIAQHDIYRS